MTDLPEYPEHEKLQAVKGEADTIAAFLEWAFYEKGYSLRTYGERPFEVEEPCFSMHMSQRTIEQCERCDENGMETVTRRNEDWHPHPTNRADIQKWLADYLGIDLDKIEDEKRQMLDELRAMNA